AGARAVHLAIADRRDRRDQLVAIGLHARRDRLAEPGSHLASGGGWLKVRPIDSPYGGEGLRAPRWGIIGLVTTTPEDLPDDIAGLQAGPASERATRTEEPPSPARSEAERA